MSFGLPGARCFRNVEPTYISTDLVVPGKPRRMTLPAIGKHEVNKAANFKWGNEVPYDAYRVLRYNQNMSKSKTKNDPSHGHFGTKVVQMNSVEQPYEVTQLKLSECRLNDQRLPPVNDELIPKSKIPYLEALDRVQPYFSHRSKFEVFPSTNCATTVNNISEKLKGSSNSPTQGGAKPGPGMKALAVSSQTLESLSLVNKNIYGTTTYMCSYQNPSCVKKSNLKRKSYRKVAQKHVTFNLDVQCYDNSSPSAEERVSSFREKCSPPPVDENRGFFSGTAKGIDGLEEDKVCRFCGKSKRKVVKLKYLDSNGKIVNLPVNQKSNWHREKMNSSSSQGWTSWPVGHTSLEEDRPNHPKIIIQGYSNRPKCSRRFSDVCECDKFPQLRASVLKAEEISKRRAQSFARRNYTTISVFHLLKHDETAAAKQIELERGKIENESKDLLYHKRTWSQKSDAHKRFHEIYPDVIPDLRDSRRNVRRVLFSGYPSHVFR